jgi:threonine/homoserine/homoserine lactone efflux protein
VGEGLAWFASATAFALSMSGSPGPNNAMVAASGATWGFRPTLPHMFGVSIGLSVMLVAVALGMGEALRAWPWLHEALRWAGAAYMLWLAWKIASADPDPAGLGRRDGVSRPLTFHHAAQLQ